MKFIFLILAVISLITFFLFGIDKQKAKKGKWRIPEKTLLLFAFFGGAAGAWAGMLLFRHKTKHKKFTILVPLFFVLHLVLIFLLFRFVY